MEPSKNVSLSFSQDNVAVLPTGALARLNRLNNDSFYKKWPCYRYIFSCCDNILVNFLIVIPIIYARSVVQAKFTTVTERRSR